MIKPKIHYISLLPCRWGSCQLVTDL